MSAKMDTLDRLVKVSTESRILIFEPFWRKLNKTSTAPQSSGMQSG